MNIKGVCGEETRNKQKDFEDLLNHHIKISWGVINRNRWWANKEYHYFDMFGGPGLFTDDLGIYYGSPVIFQNVATKNGVDFAADVFERDLIFHDELSQNITTPKIRIHRKDSANYRGLLKRDGTQFGLLYCDPDMSEKGFDLSFEIAASFAKHYPKIDILIYISATNIKRIINSKGGPMLRQRLFSIKKEEWIIRSLRDRHQYTFLLGTNYGSPFEWAKRNFFNTNSVKGKEILDKANYTNDQLRLMYQPHLI
jgi:hypothetical protein